MRFFRQARKGSLGPVIFVSIVGGLQTQYAVEAAQKQHMKRSTGQKGCLLCEK